MLRSNTFRRLVTSFAFFLASISTCWSAQRPNIVFLLADDLGWVDTSVYGSTFYETPNIDRLAKLGMRFTNAYAASPLCSPTRASILTGQWPGRLRLTVPAGHVKQVILDPIVPERAKPDLHVTLPQSRTRLPNDYVTYAEVLKKAGYQTAFLGKWHLGHEPYLPDNQGFDLVVGGRHHPGPPGGFFAPWPCDTLPKVPEGTHIDDAITAEAVRFVEANREEPFLLNLWFYSVHAPFQAKEDLIVKYRAKAKKDPESLQRNPVMGGMIETLDDNVGRVLDAIERLGLAKNTLIVFTSDNGGNEYNRVEGLPPTNNAPLRNGKGNIYEGGQRVPLILAWPGKIAKDTTSDAVVSSVDLFPTVLATAGQPLPKGQVCDGEDLWPILEGEKQDSDRAIFCHFPHLPVATGSLPATSVRTGDAKLLRFFGDGPEQADRLELYDLSEDIGETTNLASAKRDEAKQLNALIGEHLAATESLVPKKNPSYEPCVLGWRGSKIAKLTRGDGTLVMESSDDDPWMATEAFPPIRGKASLEIRMKSNAKGRGAVYFASRKDPRFSRERMIPFEVQHDSRWHMYHVEFASDQPVGRLRIDPAMGPGTIEIDSILLIRWTGEGTGNAVRRWTF